MKTFKNLTKRTLRRTAAAAAAGASLAAIGAGAAPSAHAATVQNWKGAGTAYFAGDDGHRVMLQAKLGTNNVGQQVYRLNVGNYVVDRSSDIRGAQDVVASFQLQQASLTELSNWHDIGWAKTVTLGADSMGKEQAGPQFNFEQALNSSAKAYRVVADFRWTRHSDPSTTLGRRVLTPSMASELSCSGRTLTHCVPFATNDGTGNAGVMLR